MARICRSNADKKATKIQKWFIAVYFRLSREDGNDESLSVTNQRKIVLDFIEDNFSGEQYAVVDYYIDDGCSGTTEETRPEYQRMIEDIKAGKVNCVICKTLSRAFRNYADQGHFLEEFAPAYQCRFISVSNPFVDTFTSPECVQGLEIPINGLLNDRYAAKTSADIRRTFDTKRKRGEFIGAFAPYGYQKSPEDKNRLIIDEEAAQVVRDIYRWFVLDGMSKKGISKHLNALKIPNPAAYKKGKGLKFYNPNAEKSDGLWTPKTVSDILQNQMYIGNMVQGKQRIVSYKVHERVAPPPEQWYIVENTHQPIIERELFQQAQALCKRNTRTAPKKKEVYLFSGFVRCADCKKTMHRKESKNIVYYSCRTFSDKGSCTGHSIRLDVLERAVLVSIQKQIELVTSLSQIVEEINAAPKVNTQSKRLSAMLKQRKKELEKTSLLLDSLYVDWKSGDISREQYSRMRLKFEEQSEQLKQAIEQIQENMGALAQGITSQDPYFTSFLKYRNVQTLSRGLLVELINAIYVHENKEIEIEFNFSDQYKRIVDFIENNRRELRVIASQAVS